MRARCTHRFGARRSRSPDRIPVVRPAISPPPPPQVTIVSGPSTSAASSGAIVRRGDDVGQVGQACSGRAPDSSPSTWLPRRPPGSGRRPGAPCAPDRSAATLTLGAASAPPRCGTPDPRRMRGTDRRVPTEATSTPASVSRPCSLGVEVALRLPRTLKLPPSWVNSSFSASTAPLCVPISVRNTGVRRSRPAMRARADWISPQLILTPPREIVLAPRLVDGDARGVGRVVRAAVRAASGCARCR